MRDLADEVVFVTGATAGFGAAIARRFAAAGARVAICGRRAERLEALARELGDRVLPVPLDIADRAAVARAFTGLPADFSPITVLVNNAGLALDRGPAQAASLDDWLDCVAVNINGVLHCTHAVLADMVKRDRGHIVNISSISGNYPTPGSAVYGPTKSFLNQFSLNLRADLFGTSVRVTCVQPGAAETEFMLQRWQGDVAKVRSIYEGYQPLLADDIAELVITAVAMPAHVNVNQLEVMPVAQTFAGRVVARKKPD